MRLSKVGTNVDSWFVRNASIFTRFVELVFGIIWLTDASFKFQPSFGSSFTTLISQAAAGQPAWLQGWYSFWIATTSSHPFFFVYLIALSELAVALALIFGFMRKTAYAGGIMLSLLIWSVPEGFGGPYGPSSTDIGTGIIYAIVFLLLLALNATYRNNKYTADHVIEKKVKWWSTLAELNR
jgi:nitrite reductase (NO-forming)